MGVKGVVKEEPPKKVEPVAVETPKVIPKIVQEPVVQKTEGDKMKDMFITVGGQFTNLEIILTSSNDDTFLSLSSIRSS